MNTVESISTPINTVESIRKPFLNLKAGHIPFNKFTKNHTLSLNLKPKASSKSKNNRTTTSSPNKVEMIAKLKDELIEKDKIINGKEQEISRLKDLLQSQDSHIKDIEKELKSFKENKQEETEYDEYAKKQMVRNVKMLTAENRQLREEISEYKEKEIKLMKLLYEMKKRGIPIEEMIDCIDESTLNNKSNNNPLTENSEVSALFTPLILNTEDNFTVKPDIIPKLNFNQLNEKYNEEHFCFPAKQTNTQATSGTSNNTNLFSGTSNNSHSHDFLPNKQQQPIKLTPNTNIKHHIIKKKAKN